MKRNTFNIRASLRVLLPDNRIPSKSSKLALDQSCYNKFKYKQRVQNTIFACQMVHLPTQSTESTAP